MGPVATPAETANVSDEMPASSIPATRISVVTSAFHAAGTLTDTLESVRRQCQVEHEHILVDGGSRDATADVVRRHGAHLRHFVSEPDRGIYDGMNKGAALATGDVIGFLNADDWLAGPDVLARVAQAFDEGADLVYGDLVFVDAQPPYQARRTWTDANHAPEDFVRIGWQPAHPTTYVRRSLFEGLGGFDLRWSIAADYAFLARAMQQPDLRLHHVPQTLVNMRLGGASTAHWRAVLRANRQCLQALRTLGSPHPAWTLAQKLWRKSRQVHLTGGLTQATWRPWDSAQPSGASA